MRKLSPILALTVVASGCYSYSPVPVDTVTPEMIVRVEVQEGSGTERVEGQIFEVQGGSFSLLPEVRPGEDNAPRTLAFSEVNTVAQRTLDTRRTLAVLGIGIAAGVGTLLLADGEPGSTGNPPGGPGDFDLLPILRSLIGSR